MPENEVKHVKKYIENHPSDRILLSSLPANLKRKITKDQYFVIFREMELEGKGKIEETNNVTGPKGVVFVKKKKTDHQPSTSSTTNQQQASVVSTTNEQATTALTTNQQATTALTTNQQATTALTTNQQQINQTSSINNQETNEP